MDKSIPKPAALILELDHALGTRGGLDPSQFHEEGACAKRRRRLLGPFYAAAELVVVEAQGAGNPVDAVGRRKLGGSLPEILRDAPPGPVGAP